VKDHRIGLALAAALAATLAAPAAARPGQMVSQQFPGLDWQRGPATARVGSQAEIHVPRRHVFCGPNDAAKLMEMCGNPRSGLEAGAVCDDEGDWILLFEWEDVGFVRDDEKDELDADRMLDAIRAGNALANEERQGAGMPTMRVIGWHQRPHYDEETHNLEWCIVGESEGEHLLNYNIRLLGRRGVMSATLICDIGSLAALLPETRELLSGFEYVSGERYGDFVAGDSVAEVGLAALVIGGTGAVALKTGLLQKLWKLLLVGFAALAAVAKKLWRFVTGREKSEESELEWEPVAEAPRSSGYVHPLEMKARELELEGFAGRRAEPPAPFPAESARAASRAPLASSVSFDEQDGDFTPSSPSAPPRRQNQRPAGGAAPISFDLPPDE